MHENLKAVEKLTEDQRRLFDSEMSAAYDRGRKDEGKTINARKARYRFFWGGVWEAWRLIWRVALFCAAIGAIAISAQSCLASLEHERAIKEVEAAEAVDAEGVEAFDLEYREMTHEGGAFVRIYRVIDHEQGVVCYRWDAVSCVRMEVTDAE